MLYGGSEYLPPSEEELPGITKNQDQAYIDYESLPITDEERARTEQEVIFAKDIDGFRVLVVGDPGGDISWENVTAYLLDEAGGLRDSFWLPGVEKVAELGLPVSSFKGENELAKFLLIDNEFSGAVPYKPEIFSIRDGFWKQYEDIEFRNLGLYFGRDEAKNGALFGSKTMQIDFPRSAPYALYYDEEYDAFYQGELLPFDENDEVIENFTPAEVYDLSIFADKTYQDLLTMLGAPSSEFMDEYGGVYVTYDISEQYPFFMEFQVSESGDEILSVALFSQAATIPYLGKYSCELFGFELTAGVDATPIEQGPDEAGNTVINVEYWGLEIPGVDYISLYNVVETGYSAFFVQFK